MNKTQQKRFQSLYQQHVNALRRQGKSKSTIDLYAHAVRRIAEYFDRCPDKLTNKELNEYFDWLVQERSWSTVKVDRNGLQFFYKHVLGKQWQWVDIVKAPIVKRLPDILNADELTRLINGTKEARYQTYFLAVYSMGLRLGEGLNLRVGDIDSQVMRIHLRDAKGRKDRYVTLPKGALLALRRYWASHRNASLLFPAGTNAAERRRSKVPMNRSGVQKALKAIIKDCGIHKSVSIHTLRHCYGSHLVEQGLHLRSIQREMGHDDPRTTAIYTQLTELAQQNTQAIKR